MDVGAIRDLVRRPPSRRARLVLAAALLLAVPVLWSVRQSRMTREALDRATAAERTASQARSAIEEAQARLKGELRPPRDTAIRRSRHDDPREIERVKRLYDEIDRLSHARERVDEVLRAERPYVPKAPLAAE